ncbi:hypothetical protein [Streptomyces lavendulae]|uniref:hypothetical protein n=1 Tax=Streptomyces lavendulae TaxID=1914 RepID=UPI002555DB3D|nr:hypothetical protein [Streptomyces lavendulae]
MQMEKAQAASGGGGCLTGVVRVPVKIVAVLVVLPVRALWDLLVAGARGARRHVLAPLGRGVGWVLRQAWLYVLRPLSLVLFYWPWVGLWRYVVVPVGGAAYTYLLRPLGLGAAWLCVAVGRYVLVPVGSGTGWVLRYVVVLPAGWLYRELLTPLGHGLRWLVRGLCMVVFVWPWVGLWRYLLVPGGRGLAWVGRHVLVPAGNGLAWVGRYVLLPPLSLLYRYVLLPLGELLVGAWHIAGRILRALGRGLRRLWRGWVARPAAWVYRQVATPVGHAVREVWRTARAAVREARAEVRRLLFGGPPGEPARSRARTLGSTTAADAAPAPEISPRKRRG